MKKYPSTFKKKDNMGVITTCIFHMPPEYYSVYKSFYVPNIKRKIDVEKAASEREISRLTHDDCNFTFINDFGHIMSINKALIDIEVDDDEEEKQDKYNFLHAKNDFPLDAIDSSNPMAYVKRQKEILKKLEEKREVVDVFRIVKTMRDWVIILCHGGKFTILVFEKDKLIVNKSDSKYVSRKKAGGRQLNKDKRASVMNSVGSQMRRENEKLHQGHIEDILEEHSAYLDKADIIFLHAPGMNKYMFIKENQPLHKHADKLKRINIASKKANFSEALKLAEKLIQVKIKICIA